MRYLEPTGAGKWAPVKLKRADQLSFYYCSAIAVKGIQRSGDMTGVGGCKR